MIYLDNNATTRVHEEVATTMAPYLNEEYGNPSTGYPLGKRSREAIDHARQQVAEMIGALPGEIIFTSCGTESDNAAIASALAAQPGKRHLITSSIEHSAVILFASASFSAIAFSLSSILLSSSRAFLVAIVSTIFATSDG